MDGYMKAAVGAIIAVVLYISLEKQARDIALVISVIACAMVATVSFEYLQPIISFFTKVQSLGEFDFESVSILLQCAGIGIFTEIASLICSDSGNAALGRTLQLSASIIILWISLPLLTKLIELIEGILLLK